MKRDIIKPDNFRTDIFELWDKQWLLLTAGELDHEAFNSMTVAWGSIGVMWNKPFVQVVVRPTRHTINFIEKFDTFTLCAFGEEFRDKLRYFGRVSGKDENKAERSGLKVIPSEKIECPAYDDAELIIECRKIYSSRFTPSEFIDPVIESKYPDKDYHHVFYGEILKISGTDKYSGN